MVAEIVNLPRRPAPDPERPIGLPEFLRGPATIELSMAAALRWTSGFDPRDAAVFSLTAFPDHASAAFWWRNHITRFRNELRRRHLAPSDIQRLASDYTAATRAEVDKLRATRMARQDWHETAIVAMIGATHADTLPAPVETAEVAGDFDRPVDQGSRDAS